MARLERNYQARLIKQIERLIPHSYVRKIAFCRRQFPAPVAMALRLRAMVRPGSAGGGLAA